MSVEPEENPEQVEPQQTTSIPGNPYAQEDYDRQGWQEELRANNWMVGDR